MDATTIVVRVGDLHSGGSPVATAEALERDVEVTREAQTIRIRMPTAEMTLPIDAAEHLIAQLERAMKSGGFDMTNEYYFLRGSK